jgi:hypothetical protein
MGNPLDPAGTVFSLCIYDDGGNQVGDSIIVDRAGQNCAANPCWKSTSNGYKYVDPNSTEDGVFKIRFKGGISGKSKAILNGRGPNLPDGIPAALQNSANATFQLRASDGQCLTATVAAIKQGANIFKAK